MKKVHILPAGKPSIEGYLSIPVHPNESIEMSEHSDNSFDNIFAPDLLDVYSKQNHQPLLNLLATKLRMGGTMVIGGTNLSVFCKSFVNGLISEADSSEIVSTTSSMSTPRTVSDMVRAMGLKIDSVHIDGLHFEVKTSRGNA